VRQDDRRREQLTAVIYRVDDWARADATPSQEEITAFAGSSTGSNATSPSLLAAGNVKDHAHQACLTLLPPCTRVHPSAWLGRNLIARVDLAVICRCDAVSNRRTAADAPDRPVLPLCHRVSSPGVP
jgi:hypothetical protein